jgi:hypothetical protein
MCKVHDGEPELARLSRLRKSQIKGLLVSPRSRSCITDREAVCHARACILGLEGIEENRGGLGQREMAITQGKMPLVFGMVVLATVLIAAPAAHAACRSPKNICKHFDDCLQRTSDPNNKDADGIRAGVKARNGQIVLAGAEACARDLGRKQQWDKWARGCSELEFVQIAKVGLELGKVHCDRYSQ